MEDEHIQEGLLAGANPIAYSSSDPIILFIIQASIIIVFCRLLQYPLSWLRQPSVIAEVIGGILLGPSALMRIPGFKDTVFPAESLPVLSNVANLGLILFLFLVGLEVDFRTFAKNWKVAASVGLAGMVLPFGLGCAIAKGLFDSFHDDGQTENIPFPVYAIFIGTALSITAFPVLCRILSELGLLATNVGMTVLAAGVGNDVTGWILLALVVGMVNNGSGLTALWVMLCCAGWMLFLVFGVRPIFLIILRRTGTLRKGPTQGVVALTLLLVLLSSWFTAVIGVHAIFGAFLVGLICPHEGGFAIKLTSKIEDIVSVLFLPLYFALSGLKTDIGLLDGAEAWGYAVGVIAVAFVGKVLGGALAARACQLLWRESLAIGVLMSCKGLVELIVLNIGLQASIISERTFTIFVLMALITTVTTTPLARWIYPSKYHKTIEETTEDKTSSRRTSMEHTILKLGGKGVVGPLARNVAIQLSFDNLPELFGLASWLNETLPLQEPSLAVKEGAGQTEELKVHGIHMRELTERTSSVMYLTESENLDHRDPIVKVFRTMARMGKLRADAKVAMVPRINHAERLVSHSVETGSDLFIIPWVDLDETVGLDGSKLASPSHGDFVSSVFELAGRTIISSVLISRSPGSFQYPSARRKLMVPLIGGKDDWAALDLAIQLGRAPRVELTVVRVICQDRANEEEDKVFDALKGHMLMGSTTFREVAVSGPANAVMQCAMLARVASAGDTIVVGRRHEAEIEDAGPGPFSSAIGSVGAGMVMAKGDGADILVVQGCDHRDSERVTCRPLRGDAMI